MASPAFGTKTKMADSEDFAKTLRKASGADARIDRAIAERFAVASADYSSSVDLCRSLVGQLLPEWRLHVGYGANGIFPYASLSKGDETFTADAPTLPLAVLRVLFDSSISRLLPRPSGGNSAIPQP